MTIALPTELEELFVARTHARPIIYAEEDASTGSRVGGPPPEGIGPVSCPACGGPTGYYLTAAGDLLGERVSRGRAVSIFYCTSFDCRWDHGQYLSDPPAVVALVHDDRPRASGPPGFIEGRRMLVGAPLVEAPDRPAEDGKVGGQPGYLQSRGHPEGKKAETRGAAFIFQVAELGSLTADLAPFSHGNVYLFGQADPETRLPELRDPLVFWLK